MKTPETVPVLVRSGWKIVSDGPSGVQLEGPKKMKMQTAVALVLGVFLIFVYGIGLIVVAFALIDYAMTKPQTKFIPR